MKKHTQEFPGLLMRWRIALFQALLVFLSLVLAWLLRFDFQLPDRLILLSAAPILILIRLGTIGYFGLLHGWWRYAGVKDAVAVIKAVTTGTVVFWIVMRYLLGVAAFPRSIYVLEALLTAGILAGVRLLSRVRADSAREDSATCKRVIIFGAGFAAGMIVREITRTGSGYLAVACVDDDRSKLGIKIHGVPVVGTVDQLPELLQIYPADEVLIAVPSATGAQMHRFVQVCEKARINFKTVPTLKDIIAGQVSIRQIREVNLDDLLGREPIRIDLQSVRKQIEGRTILVTGAAGSIGSELCRQILTYDPAKLICVDQSETGIFFLRLDLTKLWNRAELVFCVADVRQRERMHGLFSEHSPPVVFHAAAYKHVPLMELNVHEAVQNNVFGLLGLLDVAEEAGCETFVLISSDKAVNPANVMGATKRVGELILSSRPANGMRCVSVRFGNVLGSSGSVVPVLKQQLRLNQPLTITHPDVRRFFMITREAVALVLQAFAIGNHGDILVLDMGEPVSILELARSLIQLSGKSEKSVSIEFTGLREGEKLQEELFYAHEAVFPTMCEKIKRTRSTLQSWSELQRHLAELRESLFVDGAAPIRAKIQEIVPQYIYKENGRSFQVAASASGRLTDKE